MTKKYLFLIDITWPFETPSGKTLWAKGRRQVVAPSIAEIVDKYGKNLLSATRGPAVEVIGD